MSLEVMILLTVDVLDSSAMPCRLNGWLKRSFDEADFLRILACAGDKVISIFDERSQYRLTIEDESTGRFTATRMGDQASEQGTASASSVPSSSGPTRRARNKGRRSS
jgi:hypothetical protein